MMTEEQLQQILADDEKRQLVQQLGFAKRAFKHDALKNDTPDVEGEWEKFAASHANELDAFRHRLCRLPSRAKHPHFQTANGHYGASDRQEASHIPARKYD